MGSSIHNSNFPQRIILIGLSGSGKSSIGYHLAQLLSLPFVETDSFVETQQEMSIEQIFLQEGEENFRHYEHQALQKILAKEPQCVLSTGGGIIEREQNRDLIAEAGFVVYISTKLELIASRLEHKTQSRPLLSSSTNLLEKLTNLNTKREAFYLGLADFTFQNNKSILAARASKLLLNAIKKELNKTH